MIAHEFFELDDIIEELRMVTDTLCALEVATTESSSIIPGEAWTLPCLMLKKSYKGLDGEVQHGLHEGQEAGRRCGSMNEIGKTKQRQTLITPKGRETFRLLMIG